MDKAERYYGMVTITVESDPVGYGSIPAWANVVEIADEAIQIAIRRNKEEGQVTTEHKGKLDD